MENLYTCTIFSMYRIELFEGHLFNTFPPTHTVAGGQAVCPMLVPIPLTPLPLLPPALLSPSPASASSLPLLCMLCTSRLHLHSSMRHRAQPQPHSSCVGCAPLVQDWAGAILSFCSLTCPSPHLTFSPHQQFSNHNAAWGTMWRGGDDGVQRLWGLEGQAAAVAMAPILGRGWSHSSCLAHPHCSHAQFWDEGLFLPC